MLDTVSNCTVRFVVSPKILRQLNIELYVKLWSEMLRFLNSVNILTYTPNFQTAVRVLFVCLISSIL